MYVYFELLCLIVSFIYLLNVYMVKIILSLYIDNSGNFC